MKIISYIITLFMLLFLFACGEDDRSVPGGNGHAGPEDMLQVKFQVKIPGAEAPQSRALEEDDEYAIESIDLLLFKVTTGGDLQEATFFARGKGENPTADAGDGQTYTFTSRFLRTEELLEQEFQAVVLANAREEVEQMEASGLLDKSVAYPKVKVYLDLQYSLPVTGWKANGSNDFRHFPMWGESGVVNIPANGTTLAWEPITLLRAVARVDVGVGYTSDSYNNQAAGIPGFTLKEVWVYNANKQGTVAPLAHNYNVTDTKVTAPTIPTDVGQPHERLAIGSGASQATPYICATGAHEITRSIYLPEFELLQNPGLKKKEVTCLVVGGVYGSGSNTTYYRVDFFDPTITNAKHWMNILRNHRYRFNIEQVSGPGYDTPQEAFAGSALNIQTNIIPWNESNLTVDMTRDEQYSLSLSTNFIDLYRDATYSGIMDVQSDHPNGWSIEYPENTWFRVTPEQGESGEKTTLTITALSDYESSVLSREAFFYIKAGRLKKIVKVAQFNTDPAVQLTVEPDVLRFTKNAQYPQSVRITTTPEGLEREIEPLMWSIFWEPGNDPLDFSYSDATMISLLPDASAYTGPISDFIIVKVNDNGKELAKVISVQISDAVMAFEYAANNPYSYKPGTYNFNIVAADAPWWFTYHSGNPAGMINSVQETEFPAHPSGNALPVSFRLTENPTFNPRTAILDVHSHEPNFPPGLQVALTQEANVPTLEVRTPALTDNKYLIDFGTSTTLQRVVVRRNADLKLTYDANYANVTSTPKVTESVHAAADATKFSTAQFPFTPVTTPNNKGTIYKSTITISTNNNGVRPAAVEKVELWRWVPAYFEDLMVSIPTIVSPFSSILTATVNTNTKWRMNLNGTTFNSPSDDNSAANQKMNITVPDAPNTLWSGTRTLPLTGQYRDADGTWVNDKSFSVKQQAYSAVVAWQSTATIPATGGTVEIDVAGSYPAGTVSLIANPTTTKETLNTASIARGTSSTVTFTVPEYTELGQRVIQGSFYGNTTSNIIQQGPVSQYRESGKKRVILIAAAYNNLYCSEWSLAKNACPSGYHLPSSQDDLHTVTSVRKFCEWLYYQDVGSRWGTTGELYDQGIDHAPDGFAYIWLSTGQRGNLSIKGNFIAQDIITGTLLPVCCIQD